MNDGLLLFSRISQFKTTLLNVPKPQHSDYDPRDDHSNSSGQSGQKTIHVKKVVSRTHKGPSD